LRETKREPTATQAMTVWATPDRLDTAHLSRVFGSEGPDVIILEEAQTITATSYAFRPSMLGIKEILVRFPKALFVAAAPARGAELRPLLGKALGIKAFTAKKSPSLAIIVEQTWLGSDGPILRVERDPEAALDAVIGPLPRPALVLCGTPAEADEVYAELESAQVPVHRVHSGLPAAERARELVHFALPGRRAVMVAVSSFGPSSGLSGAEAAGVPEGFGHGYSRQDLRTIVHLCAPCSLDQYVKELSMLSFAPRRRVVEAVESFEDGGEEELDETSPSFSETTSKGSSPSDVPRSFALMLFDPEHLADNLALLEKKRPTRELLKSIATVLLGSAPGALVPRTRIEQETSSSAHRVASVLAFLADLKVVELTSGDVRVLLGAADFKKAVLELEESFDRLCAGDVGRLQEVENYAVAPGCRVRALATLLGQSHDHDCGACDSCSPLAEAAPAPQQRLPVERQGSVSDADPADETSSNGTVSNKAEGRARTGKVTPLRGSSAGSPDTTLVSASAESCAAESSGRGRRAPARKSRKEVRSSDEFVTGEFLDDAGSL
jgi:hypothetical protein